MRSLALLLISAISLASSSAFAASYQQIDGTIVDPIQSLSGGDHPYSGNNLEPFASLEFADLADANLFFADLADANLNNADLSNANLTSADLTSAGLANADLTGANLYDASLADANLSFATLTVANLISADLTSADLFVANLTSADLTGADLSNAFLFLTSFSNADLTNAILANATGLGASTGAALYDINTDFTNAWADGDWGTPGTILFDPVAAGWTLVPVPEPGTGLLMGLGLAGLAARRR